MGDGAAGSAEPVSLSAGPHHCMQYRLWRHMAGPGASLNPLPITKAGHREDGRYRLSFSPWGEAGMGAASFRLYEARRLSGALQ